MAVMCSQFFKKWKSSWNNWNYDNVMCWATY